MNKYIFLIMLFFSCKSKIYNVKDTKFYSAEINLPQTFGEVWIDINILNLVSNRDEINLRGFVKSSTGEDIGFALITTNLGKDTLFYSKETSHFNIKLNKKKYMYDTLSFGGEIFAKRKFLISKIK